MKLRHAPATIDLDALAVKLAPLVASLLVARLTGDVWPRPSARRDAPPGVSPRRWSKPAREIGRRLPGARYYTVEREAWDRYLGSPPRDPAEWSPASDLARQGLRAVRGPR